MADAKLTLLDIARMNNSDRVVGLIEEAAEEIPELGIGFARTIKGTQYKTLKRTALPAAGFRNANEGIEVTKSTYVNDLVETFILDPSWWMDTAVADAHEDGPEAATALEAGGHMISAMQSVSKQFYYGTASGVSGAAKGFQGLVDFVDATMIVDATGSTADTASSVWGVKFGIKNVAFVWGMNGALTEGDIEKVLKDISNKSLWVYAQQIQGYLGLQIGHAKSVGRIYNLTAQADKTLTDDMTSELLSLYPVGITPDYWLMSRRSLRQLQQSRTATNSTGAPAPFPTESHGIPIRVTDAILDTEAIT